MEHGNGTPGWLKAARRLLAGLGKYKYALAVLLAGACLMLLPVKGTEQSTAPAQTAEQPDPEAFRQALASLLSGMEGAGRVEVLLSIDYGAEQIYQTDERSTGGGAGSVERETVLDGASRQPVVAKTRYPVYRGAVVVCEGAEKPSVKLAIVQAVSRLTGLGSDKISVIKMKGQ